MQPPTPHRDTSRRAKATIAARSERRFAHRQKRATGAVVQTFARGLMNGTRGAARRAPEPT